MDGNLRVMDLEFRALHTVDLKATTEIWHQGWIDGHAAITPPELARLRTRASFADRLERLLPYTRVAADKDILGFSILKQDRLYQFYVAPSARGKGVAARLLLDAESQLRQAGITKAWLACAIGNVRAERFYQKSGWLDAGTEVINVDTTAGPFPLEIRRLEKDLSV